MELAAFHERIEALLGAKIWKLVRFLIAGGTAAASNLILFFVLVQFGNIYYLYASITSFVFSMVVSFTLQKFWTFRDSVVHDVPQQFARYAFVLSLSLMLNVVLLYSLVETLAIWTFFAQAIAVVVIAMFNYFGYQYFVFRDRSPFQTP